MNKRTSLPSIILTLGLLSPAPARQQPTVSPAPAERRSAPRQEEDEVVRITSNLVQIDVSATDKEGRPVTDLNPEDFEIFEDGKQRQITNFSYISTEPAEDNGAPAPPPTPARPAAKGSPPAAAGPLHRRQVRRTIGIVVDNFNAGFGEVGSARDGLRKFVDEQMRPGDLVGIYTTRGGIGALEQFTSDKARLHKAIEGVRWYPPLPNQPTESVPEDDARARAVADERNHDHAVNPILRTLRFVLRGMHKAPGRKSVVVFASGPRIMGSALEVGRTITEFDRVIELAHRASAVIYTVDSRGVFIPGSTSLADIQNSPTPFPGQLRLGRDGRSDSPAGQSSPYSDSTGGFFLHTMNDMALALRRVMLDQSGYYLIGYRPSEETFRGGRDAMRSVSVRVKRPGVKVRARKGFIAVTDEGGARAELRGSDRELYAVLASPVNAGDVYVRLTATPVGDQRGGDAAIRLLLHIDGRDLTFTDAPEGGGWKKLGLDVAAVMLGKNGEVLNEFTRAHTVKTGGEAVEKLINNGLTYTADMPLKMPGAYHVRIVVRDQASQRMGSASQLIAVPDLSKEGLVLSGLSLREAGGEGARAPAESSRPAPEAALALVTDPSDPAVRRFRPGAVLRYAYQIHTARAAGSARLTAQVRLFRDGVPLVTGAPAALELGPARTWAEGTLQIGSTAKPGDYVLQIVVTDESVKDKGKRQASQWIDFEVR